MIEAAVNASWIVNWILLFSKLFVAITSHSKAVYAGLADSIVDLLSQLVLSLAAKYMDEAHESYPIGRSKLEALSVLACSAIMTVCSIEIIQYSSIDLIDGIFKDVYPSLDVTAVGLSLLAMGLFMKLILFAFCKYAMGVSNESGIDMLGALAEDHLNDVFSYLGTIAAVVVTVAKDSLWWVDPACAIVISLVIIYRWTHMIYEQVSGIYICKCV